MENQNAKAQTQINELLLELSELKFKWYTPFQNLKNCRKINKVLFNLVDALGNALWTYHTFTDTLEVLNSNDVLLEQRINKLWAEVFKNEEDRRTLEQRIEAVERNVASGK